MGGRAEGGVGKSLQWMEMTSEHTDVKSEREESRLCRGLGDEDEEEDFDRGPLALEWGDNEDERIARGDGGALRVGCCEPGEAGKARGGGKVSPVPEASGVDDINDAWGDSRF